MSVNFATLGMFRDCCGGARAGGGGAVPGSGIQRDSLPALYVKVKKLDIESKNIILSKIKVVLKGAGE